MSNPDVISDLTPFERAELAEALWKDLGQRPELIPSPAWHEEVLAERLRLAASGEAKWRDWEEVKRELIDELKMPR